MQVLSQVTTIAVLEDNIYLLNHESNIHSTGNMYWERGLPPWQDKHIPPISCGGKRKFSLLHIYIDYTSTSYDTIQINRLSVDPAKLLYPEAYLT